MDNHYAFICADICERDKSNYSSARREDVANPAKSRFAVTPRLHSLLNVTTLVSDTMPNTSFAQSEFLDNICCKGFTP